MKNKTLIGIAFISLLLGSALIGYSKNAINPMAIYEKQEIVQEPFKFSAVYFCDKEDCTKPIEEIIKESNVPDCAFYNLNVESIEKRLSEKEYRLVTNNNSKTKISHKENNKGQLMHNKFCSFRDTKKILTGSFNPVKSSLYDYNVLVVIESDYLTQNYENEFEELYSGIFSSGNKVKYPIINFMEDGKIKMTVENYFCPEDNCEKQLLRTLDNANSTINGLIFSFTSTAVADEIIEESKNVDVKLVLEKDRMNMQYELYPYLKQKGINVKVDSSKETMHHKTWIIDNQVVVLGSYNPTGAGNTKNDENMLIIHNPILAQIFTNRFNDIYVNSTLEQQNHKTFK